MTEDLEIITRLVCELDERGQLSELDRDLLLDKIKRLYERVKFGSAARSAAVATAQAPAAGGISFDLPAEEADGEEDATDKVAVEPDAVSGAGEVQAVFQRRHKSTVRALYEADGRILEHDNFCRTTEPFFVENISFFDKNRRPLKRSTVPAPEASDGPSPEEAPAPVSAAETREPECCPPAHKPAVNATGQRVWGESVECPTTIGEALCGSRKGDIASAAAYGEHPSLRQMIGLNDKYLIMRDLFGGDSVSYDAAITRLDGFDNIEDAVLYLNDNYDCGPDSEAVKLLVGLVSRKLALA